MTKLLSNHKCFQGGSSRLLQCDPVMLERIGKTDSLNQLREEQKNLFTNSRPEFMFPLDCALARFSVDYLLKSFPRIAWLCCEVAYRMTRDHVYLLYRDSFNFMKCSQCFPSQSVRASSMHADRAAWKITETC